MKKFTKELQTVLLTAAKQNNFYGKRLYDKKLELVENIQQSTKKLKKFEASELVNWLEDNKPAAAKKPKSQKPAANTMLGNETAQARQLETIEGRRFIITSAQNNTKVASVFNELEKAAQKLDATLIVLPVHYNKNAFSAAVESEKEFFDEAVKPYLVEKDSWLFSEQYAKIAPSASVLPTAKYPVNAASTLNNGELATIIAGTKQQLRTLPRLLDSPICEAWVTGCCTQYNYTTTRSGSEAEQAHVFGALFVEINYQDELAITNIVQGLDGSLNFQTQESGYCSQQDASNPVAVLGDLHCEMIDEIIFEKTLAWLECTSPRLIVVHDIYHAATVSHHNINSAKHHYKNQAETVFNDLNTVIKQLNLLAAIAPVYIVESNHNSALDVWLDNDHNGIRRDGRNARLFYLINYLICDRLDLGADEPALKLAFEYTGLTGLEALNDNITFGAMDKPEKYFDFDVSQHGHKGQNGSAGNHNLIQKWGLNLVTGHTHTPTITGGSSSGFVVTVGVCASLDQGYNRGGASSWQHSHALINSNGTAQIIPMNPQKI